MPKRKKKKCQNLATSRSQSSCAPGSTLKPWRHARKCRNILRSRQGSIDIPTCKVFWAVPFRIHALAMVGHLAARRGRRASDGGETLGGHGWSKYDAHGISSRKSTWLGFHADDRRRSNLLVGPCSSRMGTCHASRTELRSRQVS